MFTVTTVKLNYCNRRPNIFIMCIEISVNVKFWRSTNLFSSNMVNRNITSQTWFYAHCNIIKNTTRFNTYYKTLKDAAPAPVEALSSVYENQPIQAGDSETLHILHNWATLDKPCAHHPVVDVIAQLGINLEQLLTDTKPQR
ncbi:unnamed protein product, partial [Urochloa humidicola]